MKNRNDFKLLTAYFPSMWKRFWAVSACVLVTLAVFSVVCRSSSEGEETTGFPTGWSDEVNLSNHTLQDHDCEIATNGNVVHVVWNRGGGVGGGIMYSKSTDDGRTWDSNIQLYSAIESTDYPDIAVSGQNVHVVWGERDGVNGIYYVNSTDSGESWNSVRRISPNVFPWDAGNPSVYANGSNVHIIWHDFRVGVNGQIFYRRSLDGGITFDNGQGVDEDRQITFSPSTIGAVGMAGSGSNISVVWYDQRDGDFEVYWMISKDNGFTWEDGLGTPHVGRKISNSSFWSVEQSIAVEGANIHIVWYDEIWPGPVYEIYYRNSTNNGVTWNPTITLSGPNAASFAPNIAISGVNAWVGWNDNRDGSHEIFFKNSTDGGVTWSGDKRLTEVDGFTSGAPRFTISDPNIHVIWTDWRYGPSEIYYKRYPDFPPDPTFNITLDEGWNLISLPLEQRNESIDVVLSSINGKWDYIQAYDPLTPEPWKTYATFKPSQLNELQSLNHRMGFWINVTEPGGTILTVSGPIPASTSINLYAGWNLVGYPSLVNETVANALWGTGADKVEVCDPAEPYHLREVGPTYVMKPGEGYWIHVVADSVWTIDW